MKVFGVILGLVVALAACFVLGFSFRDLRDLRLPKAETLGRLVGGPLSPESASLAPKQVFKGAFNHILRHYYKPVKKDDLRVAGMQGLVASLGDPHTMFFDSETARDFAIETEGNFVGIGARLSPDPMGALVVVVFRNGPADKAGLRVGDLITEVDSRPMAGTKVEDIVKEIRGKEGTPVRLKIVRKEAANASILTIRRAEVVMPTVEAELVPNTQVGYMSVSGFSAKTTQQFDEALDQLQQKNAKGLIIDLRGNGGGLLDTAVEMLSRFVEDKQVVKLRMFDGTEKTEKSLFGYKREFTYPIVVLVNSQSASASEIFAGVLSDYRVATLVGEHTYGKMSVQNVYGLVDGSSAKITIARYYIPSGRDISRKVDDDGFYVSGGLRPDVEVKYRRILDDEKSGPQAIKDLSIVPRDTQLQKAVEIIRSRTGG